jgi:aspartate carbamoyltransferase catalytic subunit
MVRRSLIPTFASLADVPHSASLQQVTNGLAVRMAVLYLLCFQPAEEE